MVWKFVNVANCNCQWCAAKSYLDNLMQDECLLSFFLVKCASPF